MHNKIIIADDHALVREGLKKILREEPDMEVIADVKNSTEVFEILRTIKPDILLLDISMPGRSGLDIIKELKAEYPALPILIISIHPEDRFAFRAFQAGAAGYLTKEIAPEELVRAIRKIVKGGTYVTERFAERLAQHLADDNNKMPHESLSAREFEVLCLIAAGKTLKQIAQDLRLSVNTISTYRARILEKMGMKTNSELTAYAIRNKLIE